MLINCQAMPIFAQYGSGTPQSSEICAYPKINLIGEISSSTLSHQNKNIINTIYDFLFGKDELLILKPFCVVSEKDGSLFIIDQDNESLLRIDTKNGEIENLTGNELILESPVGLCEFENDLLVTDSQLNKIFKYNIESDETSEFSSSLEQPTGITYLKNKKEIWVCETKNHRIVRFNEEGEVIGTIGKRGTEDGEFNFPTFIWADNRGKIYINDSMNFRIQIFSEEGKLLRIFGKVGDGTADFSRPKGIATDSFGNIYVADALFNNIQIFDQNGKFLHFFGEIGSEIGKFRFPAGIFINSEDKIFVADSFNSRVQIFQLTCDDHGEK